MIWFAAQTARKQSKNANKPEGVKADKTLNKNWPNYETEFALPH